MSSSSLPVQIACKDPILGVSIGSFDLLGGIQVVQSWESNNPSIEVKYVDLFRLPLGNIHRQKDSSLATPLFSFVDIPSANIVSFFASFLINKRSQNIYYSIGLALNSEGYQKSRIFKDTLSQIVLSLGSSAQTLLQKGEHIIKMTPLIEQVIGGVQKLFEVNNLVPSRFTYLPSDSTFYSLILSSHLTTQMCTVIESSTEAEGQRITSFLSHFLLPEQLKRSSKEYNPQVIPGLTVQLVQRQNLSPEEQILTLPRPCTWIRLPERLILQSPGVDAMREFHSEYTQIAFLEEAERKKRLTKIRSTFKLSPITAAVPWATSVIMALNEVPLESKASYAQMQLDSIVRTATTMIAVVDEKLRGTASPVLTSDNSAELCKLLHLLGKEDLAMVVSIAHIFDRGVFKKVFGIRKEALTSMSMTS